MVQSRQAMLEYLTIGHNRLFNHRPTFHVQLTQCSRVLHKNPIKKFPVFQETNGPLPRSQETVTGIYTEPTEFSPRLNTLFLKHILILSSHLRLGLFHSVFRPNIYLFI
jgi:hypothetical protein